jgi:pyrroloquinoline quinone biosynthesis protein D
MSVRIKLEGSTIPRFPRGVRLKHDDARDEWLLLAPERVVKPDPIALEILRLCDGIATLDTIIDTLATRFSADRARIETDVRAMLNELAGKRMVDF